MKYILIIILILVSTSAFSQSVERINDIVSEIEKTNFTDTITLPQSPRVETRPIQIIAFLKGDTLLKSIAKYSNSTRLRYSYYDKIQKAPIFVKDIDSVTNEVLVYAYFNEQEVIKSKIVKSLDWQQGNEPYRVRYDSDFSTEIGFALLDRQAKKFKFVGRLVEKVSNTPDCGCIAWAIVNKYEVLTTTFPNYANKYVLVIDPCPEFHPTNFFEVGSVYEINVATNSGVTVEFSVVNHYEKENFPIFWTREIKKQK